MAKKDLKPEGNDIPDILDSLNVEGGVHYYSGYPRVPGGEEIKVNYVASSQMPVLKIGEGNMKRNINVYYSSASSDNDELLHLLFGKSRSR